MRYLLVSVLLISGCISVRPNLGDGSSAPPVRQPMGDRIPGTTRDGLDFPESAARPSAADVRTRKICRTERVPSGWVIRSYETIKGSCTGAPREAAYNVAVIETLAGHVRGTVITICADQSIPDGWMLESEDRQTAECPGARVKKDQRTAMVIYKL